MWAHYPKNSTKIVFKCGQFLIDALSHPLCWWQSPKMNKVFKEVLVNEQPIVVFETISVCNCLKHSKSENLQ